jgi:DNA processing protein
VPGPVTSELSAGCHTIIREWAGMLVTSAADVIEYLSPVGTAADDPPAGLATHGATGPATGAGVGPARAATVLERDALDLEAATVLDALPLRGGMGPAEIAAKAGLDIDTVIGRLGDLAAIGFAERCDKGWRLRRGSH